MRSHDGIGVTEDWWTAQALLLTDFRVQMTGVQRACVPVSDVAFRCDALLDDVVETTWRLGG